mmetsp:Transcript_40315/g.99956  ORF Transcript_40315/g.99956 Transcript_40315/m.99956 type:complete len:215 (+) Transcript_40315:1920-2564(+)
MFLWTLVFLIFIMLCASAFLDHCRFHVSKRFHFFEPSESEGCSHTDAHCHLFTVAAVLQVLQSQQEHMSAKSILCILLAVALIDALFVQYGVFHRAEDNVEASHVAQQRRRCSFHRPEFVIGDLGLEQIASDRKDLFLRFHQTIKVHFKLLYLNRVGDLLGRKGAQLHGPLLLLDRGDSCRLPLLQNTSGACLCAVGARVWVVAASPVDLVTAR